MDLLDLTKGFKKIHLKGSQTKGFEKVNDDDFDDYDIEVRSRPQGTKYTEKYLLKESQEQADKLFAGESSKESQKGVDMLSVELTSAGTYCNVNELHKEELTQVYKEYYKNNVRTQSRLVIGDYRNKILTMIELNEVTIITGPTGCGKTTQVPQFILDSHAEKNIYCNILVTQPRRIAAISIPKRVCEERDWPLGTICGYKVGLKDCTSEDTRLTYVTVGVFLQMLINQKNMNDFTHVILDEIHERDEIMDFVLLTVKKLLSTTSRNVKVILMSATAEVQRVAAYFEKPILGKLQPAPIINIGRNTNYLVQIHYLEELKPLGQLPEIDFQQPGVTEASLTTCIKLIKQFERLDRNPNQKKSVLVFLPGIYEIGELFNRLTDPKISNPGPVKYNWFPIPLHSTITAEEQAMSFRPAPAGFRKIILATNIAESSITVPDVMFVIDFCLTKVLTTDRMTNFTSLQLRWASKANCIQRAGRAGRVMEGRVYRLVYKSIYQAFDDQCTPSILRCPLEKVILQAKLLNMGSPKSLLALALDPPDLTNIERTVLALKEIGGLLLKSKRGDSTCDGDITYLGRLMAVLPVDIHITRLLVLGHVFSCLEECIVMGACMSLKSVFSSPFLAKLKAFNSKLEWADGSCSDCIAFLNAYDVWKMNHLNGYFKRSAGGGEYVWGKRHFIQIRALKEVQILVDELTRRLKVEKIEKPAGIGRVQWSEIHRNFILKFVIAGAFYPNYFFRGARGGQANEEEAVKILGGRNPFTTVYLTNYPREQPPELYSQLIKDQMAECRQDMNITYDCSSKVYIEFRKDSLPKGSDIPFTSEVPGKICTAVYRAVKMRQLSRFMELRILPPEEAKKMAEKLGVLSRAEKLRIQGSMTGAAKKLFHPFLPGIDVKVMPVTVTHVVDPCHFWASCKDEIHEKYEKNVFMMLNDSAAKLRPMPEIPRLGEMCVAPYSEGAESHLYRARVDALSNVDTKTVAQVYFIDYGNTELIPVSKLLQYEPSLYQKIGKIPALAFECVLTKIKPSSVKNPNGKWCAAAKREFEKHVVGKNLIASIYSVVGGVVSLVLYSIVKSRGLSQQININKLLMERGFAEETEESYLSKVNNEVRRETSMDTDQRDAYNNLQILESWIDNSDSVPPPDLENCLIPLKMGGPFSPLEMKIFSCTRGGLVKKVTVAQTSVNSVLLDSDPQDPHERLVVAARVSQNQSGDNLILHHTTILPNIHGLASLVPFVFAPVIEMRVDEKRTKYTGVLCGLGADENKKARYPEHDMEIIFDSQFTWEDFCTINKLRFFMSLLLLDEKDEVEPVHTHPDVVAFQIKVKRCLLSLIEKRRPSMELHFPKKEFKWGLVTSNIKVADPTVNQYSKVSIFPFHPGVEITPDPNEKKTLLRNLELLKSVALTRIQKQHPLECKLCEIMLSDMRWVRLHLTTDGHRKKEAKLLKSLGFK